MKMLGKVNLHEVSLIHIFILFVILPKERSALIHTRAVLMMQNAVLDRGQAVDLSEAMSV